MLRPSVLVVDDDPGTVEAFEPMLKANGYAVSIANDAETGLQEIERSQPAAIILDLHLPVIDGVGFLRRLRKTARHATIPVAVVTGDYLLDDRIAAQLQSLGAQIYFKPLWEEDLIEIVERLSKSRTGQRVDGIEPTSMSS